MSRCFPFPPPGYEKKAKIDDVDLLKKEKHREKKHKKEKDKERKESKEKREKEGKDGKHKEKKDKKEKHRDKRKDKDKEKDKDKNKNSTADEKGFAVQAEGPNAVKLHEKEVKQKDEKIILSEEKLTKQHAGNNGDRARENNHLAEENKESKFVQELGRRIKNEDGVGNQLVPKYTITDQRKDEGNVRLVAKNGGTWPGGKEKVKGIDTRKIDEQGIRADVRPSGNARVQNHTGNIHTRVEGTPRHLEKNSDQTVESAVEGKEKGKEKKDDKRGDKRKDKDKVKKGHGKDKERDKEKKKEKMKEQTERKNTQLNKLKENNKGSIVGTNSFIQVSRDSHEKTPSGENLKKRKEIESNGVLHANDNWPSKLPRSSFSSNPFTENGRIFEPCQISIPCTSDRLGAATHLKVDNKERKINGVIEARPSVVSANKTTNATVLAEARPSAVSSHKTTNATVLAEARPPAVSSKTINAAVLAEARPSAVVFNKTANATVLAEPKAEASAKPPHPDSKYLSYVYSVPKLEEWSGFDDQEWLFGSSSSQKLKPMLKSSKIGETPLVWAEALHIESADVCALPYVIPY